MNAIAAEKLDGLLQGRNPVCVQVVRLNTMPMTPAVVRSKFAAAGQIEVNEHGMGMLQPDGSWLWVGEEA